MQIKRLTTHPAFASGLLALALSPAAWSASLLTNGDFEADAAVIQSPDAFTAWQAAEDGILGGVAINTGSSTPASGSPTVGAASGANYAVLDLAAPSKMSIWQSFAVGAIPVASATLSFQWFANYSGTEPAFINGPEGLDYTSDKAILTLRVDVLKAAAPAFSTSADDLVFSGYFNAPTAAGPQPYLSYSQTFTGLSAGETYWLRFAAAANRGALNVGIDDVSLAAAPIPEPATWAFMLAGLALVGAVARRSA